MPEPLDEHDLIQREENRRYWRETWKQRFITIRQCLYTVCVVLVTIFLISGLISWRKGNEKWAEFYDSQTGKVDLILSDFRDSAHNLKDASWNLKNDGHDLMASGKDLLVEGKRGLGEISLIGGELRAKIIPPASSLVTTAQRGMEANLNALEGNQVRLGGVIDHVDMVVTDNSPNVLTATTAFVSAVGHFDSAMAKIDSTINDPEVASKIDEALGHGNAVLAHLDSATGNVVVMTDDGKVITAQAAKVSTDVGNFVHGYLTDKPKWYQRFILTPLKSALGYGLTVYQITKK